MTAMPTTTSVPTQLIVTADALNVRETPSLQGKVIDVLNRGTVVNWLDSSGDDYWRKISYSEKNGWASHKYLRPQGGEVLASEFPWFEIAQHEIGIKEVMGSGDNPRIIEYLRSTNLSGPASSNDETPWCSAFVNWCVEKAGYAGTDSAWARSWLNWGRETDTPVRGCIVVFERGTGSGHVAFFVSKTRTQIKVLGGNQSDSVMIADYPASRLLGYRVPQ
jgi:uncharacterized protein (TIGR02594 family)